MLVHRKYYLADYERALRDADVPYLSPRRNGLLAMLEALDLCAPLDFLMTPQADLSLAHVLCNPVFAASDEHLITLAQFDEGAAVLTWWKRLTALAGQADAPDTSHCTHHMLSRWLAVAHTLPIHDLLGRIVHTGELRCHCAERTPIVNCD